MTRRHCRAGGSYPKNISHPAATRRTRILLGQTARDGANSLLARLIGIRTSNETPETAPKLLNLPAVLPEDLRRASGIFTTLLKVSNVKQFGGENE